MFSFDDLWTQIYMNIVPTPITEFATPLAYIKYFFKLIDIVVLVSEVLK